MFSHKNRPRMYLFIGKKAPPILKIYRKKGKKRETVNEERQRKDHTGERKGSNGPERIRNTAHRTWYPDLEPPEERDIFAYYIQNICDGCGSEPYTEQRVSSRYNRN